MDLQCTWKVSDLSPFIMRILMWRKQLSCSKWSRINAIMLTICPLPGGMLLTDLIIPESHPHTIVKCIHMFLIKATGGTSPWSRQVIVFKAAQKKSFIWCCSCALHCCFLLHFWISCSYQQCWHVTICSFFQHVSLCLYPIFQSLMMCSSLMKCLKVVWGRY